MFQSALAKSRAGGDMSNPLFCMVQGIGGSGGSGMKMARVQLPWARMGEHGAQLQSISCLIAQNTGLELSLYTSGIICSSLMGRCRVFLDYARLRIAFLPPSPAAKL